MNKIKSKVKYFFRDDIDLQHKLINITLVLGMVTLLFCIILDVVFGMTDSSGIWLSLVLLCFFISFIIANFLNRPNAAGFFLGLIASVILLPLLLFVDGGKASGMPMWLMFGAVFCWIITKGWACIILYILNVLVFFLAFYVEYNHPEYVNRLENTQSEYIDTAVSLAVVILIFGALFKFQKKLYEDKSKRLEEKEKELIEINERLEAANSAKSSFLAQMSHEIRTPINAVIGMDEMILRESNDGDILNYAGSIEVASHSLLALINDILDFSKIDAGLMEIIPDKYETFMLIKECYELVCMRASNKGLSLVVENAEDMPSFLFGDEVRIRQVISNMLTNAVKYTEKGGVTLKINYEKFDNRKINLIIEVVDTGKGISEEGKLSLFNSFTRVDEKSNKNIEGTGLGLAITKQLIELMSGEISVESTLGEGSTFRVVIPQTIVSSRPMGKFIDGYNSQRTSEEGYKARFKAPLARVLIVDDVEVNLNVMKLLLKQTELNVDISTSGRRAIELFNKNHYDIIFLDHMMPDMDGVETLNQIKNINSEINKDTKIVALTANAILGADKEYIDMGFDDYLSKPVQSIDLENMILKHLPEELVSK